MPDTRIYRIRKNRIYKALLQGMAAGQDASVVFDSRDGAREMFLGYLDGGEEHASWGRLTYDLELDDNMAAILRVAACDENDLIRLSENLSHDGQQLSYPTIASLQDMLLSPRINSNEKKKIFGALNANKFINRDDVLLYSLRGRYLFIYLEVLGEGGGSAGNFTVNMDGDFFMETFPEIYRENNSFFHRYMSVFSSIYSDFQNEIDTVYRSLDVDTAPAEMLEVFAEWMGLDLNLSVVDEDKLRTLIKEGYELCKYKGTLRTLVRVARILTGEEVTVVERARLSGLIPVGQKDFYDRLYGSNPYTVTVMVPGIGTAKEHDRLMYVLKQFTPVRCILQVVYTGKGNDLDGYSFLDGNGEVAQIKEAGLDEENITDGVFVLK